MSRQSSSGSTHRRRSERGLGAPPPPLFAKRPGRKRKYRKPRGPQLPMEQHATRWRRASGRPSRRDLHASVPGMTAMAPFSQPSGGGDRRCKRRRPCGASALEPRRRRPKAQSSGTFPGTRCIAVSADAPGNDDQIAEAGWFGTVATMCNRYASGFSGRNYERRSSPDKGARQIAPGEPVRTNHKMGRRTTRPPIIDEAGRNPFTLIVLKMSVAQNTPRCAPKTAIGQAAASSEPPGVDDVSACPSDKENQPKFPEASCFTAHAGASRACRFGHSPP